MYTYDNKTVNILTIEEHDVEYTIVRGTQWMWSRSNLKQDVGKRGDEPVRFILMYGL